MTSSDLYEKEAALSTNGLGFKKRAGCINIVHEHGHISYKKGLSHRS
jgi:hypothetical protein